jgi:heterodisulfide reductase subunit D
MPNRDYTAGQLFEMDACTKCRMCAQVCPAVAASQNGELSAVWRMNALRSILQGRGGFLQRLFGNKPPTEEQLKHFSDTVFKCTLCANCEEVCPVGIGLKDLWLSLRMDMVHSGSYPPKIDMIGKNLAGSHNVFAEDNEERAAWVEDMRNAPDDGLVKDHAEVVYFTGCVAAYFPMAQKIAASLAEIMIACEVDFTLMGENEWCCGFPLLGAGLKDQFREFAEHNMAAAKAKGAKKVVFACPSCYQAWREHYPPGIEIAHASEFLLDLLREGRVPMKDTPLTVTYHDPCDLGRGARVFDAPREAIRSIPGVRLVELSRNREDCQCCGGGGNLEMLDAALSTEIAKRKIEEVIATGAQAVVTSCQQCVRTMNTYVRRNKVQVEVLDLTQLVRKALIAG